MSKIVMVATIAFACLPMMALAETTSFLEQPHVIEVRDNMAGVVEQMADVFETSSDADDPSDRALLMLQLASGIGDILVAWEESLHASPEGDVFLEDATTIMRCVGLASVAERSAQVAMLRVASGFWQLGPEANIPADLCDQD